MNMCYAFRMSFLAEFLTVIIIHLLAVMSPGPDFAMITRSSLIYSRRTGVWSAVGLACGILVHVTYSLFGIGLVISRSILLFSFLKFLGAGYLIFIGWKSLRAKPKRRNDTSVRERLQDLSPVQALRMGFLTNVLNPKATIFFVSVFSQVINPATPLSVKAIYGGTMSVTTFLWFAFVAVMFSHRIVKERINAIHHHIERFTGAVLILFGMKLALAKAK